ncbi:MAG TPA: glycosyltransferase [Acidobacteriota bacterium]
MSKSIAQFCAGFAPGDAISTEALNIRRVMRQCGYRSEIYSWPDFIHPESRGWCKPVSKFSPSSTDLLIYHFSISSPMTRHALDFSGRKIMIYHNITPGHYFRRYDPKVADQLDDGRKELQSLSETFDLALADSEFNRKELESLNYRNTAVLPILFDPSQLSQNLDSSATESASIRVNPRPQSAFRIPHSAIVSPDPELTTRFFVGRLAPNKKAEDLVTIFGLYQKFINPRSRLFWIGSWGSLSLYYTELRAMVRDLKLRDVCFTGYVPQSALVDCYRHSDVLVSTSEHEGFCVPILESFYYGKPVIAYAAGAVPETVGEAGILFSEKDWMCFAEAIHRVVCDPELRGHLVAAGQTRLEHQFSFSRVSQLLKSYITPLL